MTSPKALAERALGLSEKATPGPWKQEIDNFAFSSFCYVTSHVCDSGEAIMPGYVISDPVNADLGRFIAESRTLLPALATEVLKLLEENKVMRGALIGLSPCGGGCEGPMGCMCKSSMAREALRKADGIRNGLDTYKGTKA